MILDASSGTFVIATAVLGAFAGLVGLFGFVAFLTPLVDGFVPLGLGLRDFGLSANIESSDLSRSMAVCAGGRLVDGRVMG